jgi:hypothetical protein
MRHITAVFWAVLLLCAAPPAAAAEKGMVIRAGDLMAQPFIDAAKAGPLAPNQPVTILERRGAWANVDSNGAKGWVRLLNLRLQPGAARPGTGAASALRTGSSGRTVTTGVKGMDEEDIRNASPDEAQVAELGTLAVSADDARADAQTKPLAENSVAYLDKGRRK